MLSVAKFDRQIQRMKNYHIEHRCNPAFHQKHRLFYPNSILVDTKIFQKTERYYNKKFNGNSNLCFKCDNIKKLLEVSIICTSTGYSTFRTVMTSSYGIIYFFSLCFNRIFRNVIAFHKKQGAYCCICIVIFLFLLKLLLSTPVRIKHRIFVTQCGVCNPMFYGVFYAYYHPFEFVDQIWQHPV